MPLIPQEDTPSRVSHNKFFVIVFLITAAFLLVVFIAMYILRANITSIEVSDAPSSIMIKQDSSRASDDILKSEWGPFSENTVMGKVVWSSDIKITNTSNDYVVLLLRSTDTTHRFTRDAEVRLDPDDGSVFSKPTDIINFVIDKADLSGNPASRYGVYQVEIKAYECANLIDADREKICVTNFGTNNVPPPWDIIKEREQRGNPVKPTNLLVRHFKYEDEQMAPHEVDLDEYESFVNVEDVVPTQSSATSTVSAEKQMQVVNIEKSKSQKSAETTSTIDVAEVNVHTPKVPYSNTTKTDSVLLTWGPFTKKTTNSDAWHLLLRAENISNDLVLIVHERTFVGRTSTRTSTDSMALTEKGGKLADLGLSVSEEDDINLTVYSGIEGGALQPDFGVYTVTVNVYACSEISQADYNLLCAKEKILAGSLNPFEAIEKRAENGDPIIPTKKLIKQYTVFSMSEEPQEIM